MATRIVFMGPSRVGKTTAIHAIAGAPHTVRSDASGDLVLEPDVSPEGLGAVGHSGASVTHEIGWWLDPQDNVALIDTPGLDSTYGRWQQMRDAFLINNAFSKHETGNTQVKMVLVVKESIFDANNWALFVQLVNRIVKSFASQAPVPAAAPDWHQACSLLVTHYKKGRDISGILGQLLALPRTQMAELYEPGIQEFIQHLRENSHRIAAFHSPEYFSRLDARNDPRYRFFNAGDAYPVELLDADRQAFLAAMRASLPLTSPIFSVSHNPEVLQHLTSVSNSINQAIAHIMSTQGYQALINYCSQCIEQHNASIATLRTKLAQLISDLDTLVTPPYAGTPETFPDRWNALFHLQPGVDNPWMDIKSVRQNISSLGEISKITRAEAADYRQADWIASLPPLRGKLQDLMGDPQEVLPAVHNSSLTLSGPLLSGSDVSAMIQAARGQGRSITDVRAYASSAFIVDGNLTEPSLALTIVSPYWHVNTDNPKVFNLSGQGGGNGSTGTTPGANGTAGTPGGPGGHFYARLFEGDLSNLEVRANGGNGGNGGNGANGTAGSHARVEFPPSHVVAKFPAGNGTDGGRPGAQGDGGAAGVIQVEGGTLGSQSTTMGTPGSPGTVGQGGTGGNKVEYFAMGRNRTIRAFTLPAGTPGNTPHGQFIAASAPGTITPIDANTRFQEYWAWYLQQASTPNLAQFVKVFPKP